MKYKCFTNILKLYQTQKIRPLSIPHSCALEQIPSAFAVLLPDITQIVEENAAHLCEPEESIAIFGMQLSGGFLTSELPRQLNRMIHAQVPDYHLCCTLDYLALKPDQSVRDMNWTGFKSVIIDFTRGIVMDIQQYCHELFQDKDTPPGKIFGKLEQKKLAAVWEIVRSEGYQVFSGIPPQS